MGARTKEASLKLVKEARLYFQEGTKTASPLTQLAAEQAFDALVAEKTKKGYQPGEAGAAAPAAAVRKAPAPAADAGTRARSIATNARPHVGAAIVVNMDLQDFFPSIAYPRVKGLLRALGYPEAVATVFALLATEPDVDEVELDGRRLFVATGPRRLPQGAPTSPAITNILCRRLDRRLAGLAASLGCAYTRYADDLTFSSPDKDAKIGSLLRAARGIVAHEGLTVHPKKTKVLRRYARQEVTGLVVNRQLSVPRKSLRNFRATLRQVELDGPAGKRWGHGPDVLQNLRGFAEFVRMVDPAKGEPLVARVAAVMARVGYQPPPRRFVAKVAPQATAPAAPPDGAERWWR